MTKALGSAAVLAALFCLSSVAANVGDAIQIDHQSLKRFYNLQPSTCLKESVPGRSLWYVLSYEVDLVLEVDTGKATEMLFQPLKRYGESAMNDSYTTAEIDQQCQIAKRAALNLLADINKNLVDISNNNLRSTDAHGGCAQPYYVATLETPRPLSNGTSASAVDLVAGLRMVVCP